jgi:hypothetical protein
VAAADVLPALIIPVGNLTFWPVPGSGEMHLFAETVLQGFTTLSDTVNLPQGYNMAIRWNLAELLIPEYGKNDPVMVAKITKHAEDIARVGQAHEHAAAAAGAFR